MGIFGLGKKNKVIDLSEGYEIEQKGLKQMSKKTQALPSDSSGLSFLGGLASSGASTSEDYDDPNLSVEDKKKRLAKRLIEMTNRIEDLSNQIYHLQQRLDLVEKKLRVGQFE